MSTITKFWETVSSPREAREKIERETRRREWDAAIRVYASVVLFGKPHGALSPIKSFLEQQVQVFDLTSLPSDEHILRGASVGAFEERGRYLVFLLDAYEDAEDSMLSCVLDAAGKVGSSYAVCFAAAKALLTYPHDFATGRRRLISGSDLVVIAEKPQQETHEEVLNRLRRPVRDLLYSTSMEEISQKIATRARALFNAAATL